MKVTTINKCVDHDTVWKSGEPIVRDGRTFTVDGELVVDVWKHSVTAIQNVNAGARAGHVGG